MSTDTSSVVIHEHLESFMEWFRKRAWVRRLEVQECRLDELPSWVVDGASGRRRKAPFFFELIGLLVQAVGGGRNVVAWDQPGIKQPDGTVGLVIDGSGGFILLRVLGEPGSRGLMVNGVNTHVLVAPPIQFSPGQLELHRRAKAGERGPDGQPLKPTPLADLVEDTERFHHQWQSSAEDPGRFVDKVNRVGVVTAHHRRDLEPDFAALDEDTRADLAWVTPHVLRNLLGNGLATSHVRAALSVLW